MVDISAIAGAVSAVNGMKSMVETMVAVRDAAALQAKKLEFQSLYANLMNAMLTLQQEHSALLQRENALKQQIAAMEKWEAEKEGYQLAAVYPGAFAYAPNPETRRSEPPHWLCTTCFQNRKKSFLQAAGRAGQSGTAAAEVVWRCPTGL